jgi:hypothetical protein
MQRAKRQRRSVGKRHPLRVPQGQRREGKFENRVPYREPRGGPREVAGAVDQDELVLADLLSPEAGPRFPPGPKGYKRSDERIREDICDELMTMGDIDSSDVEVSVNGGAVSLTGTVPDRSMKYRIESVADRCTGVVDITNLIKVRGTSRS